VLILKEKEIPMIKVRLDKETVNFLRHKGGFHSSKKGKKGYNRKQEKQNLLKCGG